MEYITVKKVHCSQYFEQDVFDELNIKVPKKKRSAFVNEAVKEKLARTEHIINRSPRQLDRKIVRRGRRKESTPKITLASEKKKKKAK